MAILFKRFGFIATIFLKLCGLSILSVLDEG